MDQKQLQRQKQEEIFVQQQEQVQQQQSVFAQPVQAQRKAASPDAAAEAKQERQLRRRVKAMGDFISGGSGAVQVKGCAPGETAPPEEGFIERMGMFDTVCDWYKSTAAF